MASLMDEKKAWSQAVADFPFGSRVSGSVVRVMPFGLIVDVADAPNVKFVADAIDVRGRGGEVIGVDGFRVGDVVAGVIVDHVAHNLEIKMRIAVRGGVGEP
ncbi:hypothetical protein [Allokutzneria oryzae]|uniref:S1 motif domain-containing protein n=1 Tax=Allokutzneria oryzae TaxID=1378989 RepID=A0ABV6A2V1_9PSEU